MSNCVECNAVFLLLQATHFSETRKLEIVSGIVTQDNRKQTPASIPQEIGPARLKGFQRQRVVYDLFDPRAIDAPDSN